MPALRAAVWLALSHSSVANVHSAVLPAALGLLAWAVSACAPAKAPKLEDWASYSGLIVPAPMLPLEASGSVQFNYRGQRESGQVVVQGNRAENYRLRVSARLLGTAALEVRFNRADLLVMDFAEETFFLGGNDAETREKLFSIDLDPGDFLIVLTGRIPRALYNSARNLSAGPGALRFDLDGAEYRFDLDPEGLPKGWIKSEHGREKFRVVYREYQAVPAGSGAIRLPRKIRIYADEPEARLVLGVSEFQLGLQDGSAAPMAFDPPPGLRFRALGEAPGGR